MNNVERFKRSAVLFPAFLLILTTIYLAEALTIRSQFGGDTIVGPRFMPILMATTDCGGDRSLHQRVSSFGIYTCHALFCGSALPDL